MNPTLTPYSAQASPSDMNSHLKNERERFRTFAMWPTNAHVKARDLARTGFYYLGISDIVRCAFCHCTLKDWEQGDVPETEHRKHFPSCPFISGAEVGNVPTEYYVPLHPGSTQLRSTGSDYSRMAEMSVRLASFEYKPLPPGQSAHGLAEAGFYYIGPDDNCRCYCCGVSLKQWAVGDKPWIEHARWFPNCNFLRLSKGQEFIDEVRRTDRGKLTQVSERSSLGRPVEEAEDETNLKTTVGTAIVQDTSQTTMSSSMQYQSVGGSTSLFAGTGIHAGIQETASSSSGILTTNEPTTKLPESNLEHVSKQNEEINLNAAVYNGSIDPPKERLTCKICMDCEVNIVFLPCSHLVCCEICAPSLQCCPMCRQDIQATIKIFIS